MVVLLVTFGYEIRSSRTNLSGKGARGNGCGTDPPSDAIGLHPAMRSISVMKFVRVERIYFGHENSFK